MSNLIGYYQHDLHCHSVPVCTSLPSVFTYTVFWMHQICLSQCHERSDRLPQPVWCQQSSGMAAGAESVYVFVAPNQLELQGNSGCSSAVIAKQWFKQVQQWFRQVHAVWRKRPSLSLITVTTTCLCAKYGVCYTV